MADEQHRGQHNGLHDGQQSGVRSGVSGVASSVWRGLFSKQTRRGLRFDLLRLVTRASGKNRVRTDKKRLHFGCGKRRVDGWLNVDVRGSDLDVDLSCGVLPFEDAQFDVAVAQQFIEHLELESELQPLLDELARVLRPGAELWVSCPDMERVCQSYLADGGAALLRDRQSRWPDFTLGGLPTSHMVNTVFHQAGEHRNLFDFRLLSWLLERHGFTDTKRVDETTFRSAYPEFPVRADDEFSLYVQARRR